MTVQQRSRQRRKPREGETVVHKLPSRSVLKRQTIEAALAALDRQRGKLPDVHDVEELEALLWDDWESSTI